MTLLQWRDADLRTGPDKKRLQRFRCTDERLKTELTALGATTTHSRIWEWNVQVLIQEEVRALNHGRWIVRLGMDGSELGGVAVAEEIDAGALYDLKLGAIASRLRRRHDGRLGDEMLGDMFAAIGERCQANGYSGQFAVTGVIHRDNFASKRMCTRNKLSFVGESKLLDHEQWSGMVDIPELDLFES